MPSLPGDWLVDEQREEKGEHEMLINMVLQYID